MFRFIFFVGLVLFVSNTAWGKVAIKNPCPDDTYGWNLCYPCPANSVCPNPTLGNKAYPYCWQVWCQAGYYSSGDPESGTLLCHKCPTGVDCPEKTTWEVIQCPAGSDMGYSFECTPLCAAGATKLHVGDNVFRIWSDGTCSSPAIKLGLPGGVCCVNLENGRDKGLNVEFNGNIYHAIN